MKANEEAKLIAKDVAKGIWSVFSPPQPRETPSEYMKMHWCEKCEGYHKAKK